MLALAFLAVGFGCFALGVLTAALCLSVREEDMQYREAQKCWRRMQERTSQPTGTRPLG